MMTRDGGRVDADRTVAVAAHQVRSFREEPVATLRDKARAWPRGLDGFDARIGRPCVAVKSVPISRDGPNEPCHPRCVTQRSPDFRHQVVQARFRDERLRPEMRQEFGLRDSLRPSIEKELQELECFGRKRRNASMAKKQAPARVELELCEE